MRRAMFALAFVLIPAASFAQSTSGPGADADRFQIDRRGDSIIRLDRKTGTISTCTETGGSLDCRASADERAALQAEIDRLANEVDGLNARLAGNAPGTGISKDGKELTLKLPTEQELKGVMGFLEEMVQRVVNAVRSLAGGNA